MLTSTGIDTKAVSAGLREEVEVGRLLRALLSVVTLY